jgi:hypothetical protein
MSRPGSPRHGAPATELQHVTWIKSSYSGPTGGNCLETAARPDGGVAVRNSRLPTGPALVFTAAAWDAFIAGVRSGRP